MDDHFIVSEVNKLFVDIVGEGYNSFEWFWFYFLWVDRREHLLDGPTNHFSLWVDTETIEDGERIFECHTEGLPSMVQDIFHSAIIHYSETHLSTSKFDDSEEIFYL